MAGRPPPPPHQPGFYPFNHAEGSSSNSVQVDRKELERLRRIEQTYKKLHITTLRAFVVENRRYLQYMTQLKAGQAMGVVPADHFIAPCTNFGKSLFDSLVVLVVDSLLKGDSWGGCWNMNTVLVINGKCFLEDTPLEDGTRLEYASRDLRGLFHTLVEIFSYLNLGYPPFFCHLMDLLKSPPYDYDTNPEARCRYLLSIRNNVAFASPSRLFALLVNFAQICCCIGELGKTKLEEIARDIMPRSLVPYNGPKRFHVHYDWQRIAETNDLIRKLTKLKKSKENKENKENKEKKESKEKPKASQSRSKTSQESNAEWKPKRLFPSLVYLLRIFVVHIPEVMKDGDGNVILEDFIELIYLIDYLLEDALPNLVEYILESIAVHILVRSMWNVFDHR